MAVWTPRRLQDGEELAFLRAANHHFHEDASDEELRAGADALRAEPDHRGWVVAERGAFVGNLGVFATDLSLPGGARLPVTAITAVGVAQTHRRRGLLRALMRACLEEAIELGEPVAALYASESAIYGRFGFGITAPTVGYRIERFHARFREPADVGLLEPVASDAAVAAFQPIFETTRRARAGIGRTALQWTRAFVDDPPSQREGASARRLVHVPGRGYAAYRIRNRWAADLPAAVVEVQDLVASDPEADAVLWQHVCDLDLTATVAARLRPPDEALPRSLVDPLRLGAAPTMPLYTRILDVPRVLESRGYAVAGRAVLRIFDVDRRRSATWDLQVDAESASCRPTDADPDLELSIEGLSSVWLGGVRTTQLLDARQVVEHSAGAAASLDRLLAVDRAPWTSFMF